MSTLALQTCKPLQPLTTLFIKLTLQTSWVASTLLPSDEQAYVQTGHGLYDPSQSTSAQPLDGENFEIGYGDGSGSSGPEYTETVVLGDVALAGMPIGVANMLHLGTGQTSRNSDGPVGLGFQSLNSVKPDKQPTFAEALQSAGALSKPVFTTHLTTDDSGVILFGEYDSSLYTGSLTQVPVDNSAGFWVIDNVSFGMNGQQFSSAPINMIGDTGGGGLDIPADALASYFSIVQGSGQDSNGNYFYPCGTDLPALELYFPSVLNGGPGSASISGQSIKDGDGDAGQNCYTHFGAASDQGSLGIPFFVSQYIEWDMSVPSMAFAQQA